MPLDTLFRIACFKLEGSMTEPDLLRNRSVFLLLHGFTKQLTREQGDNEVAIDRKEMSFTCSLLYYLKRK